MGYNTHNIYKKGQEMAEKGESTGRAVWGYRFTIKNGIRNIVIDEQKAPLVKDAFYLYATGAYSLEQISEHLIEKYGMPIPRSSLQRALTSKFYIGILVYGGKEYAHNYQQFIPRVIWDKVNQILANYRSKKIHTKYKGRFFLFRGQITCEACGSSYCAQEQKGTVYYCCTQHRTKRSSHPGRKYLNERVITEKIADHCKQYQVDFQYLKDHPDKMRIYCKLMFSQITAIGDQVTLHCNDGIDGIGVNLNEYLRDPINVKLSIRLPKQVQAKIENELVTFCKTPKSIEEIMEFTKQDLSSVQSKLFDLQLEGLLDENENGKWIQV